ncbi:hypothetical protein ACQP1V_42775 (plasmid) [Microtetraspora malaysiensis]|uniref:hypothetical protein n=1 Tax=Microtetraspora malaysiensis TaxID=161358 RepID=UPI003D918B73
MNQGQGVNVDWEQVVAALRRRIDGLVYENALLSAAVDQQQARINELGGGGSAGDHSG